MPPSPAPVRPRPPLKRPWWRKWRRLLYRQFPRRKQLHGGWLHRLFGNRLFDPHLWKPERTAVAMGFAFGIFVGLIPMWLGQVLVAAAIAVLFRVNVTAAVLGTFISNPFTLVPLVVLQVKIGHWMLSPRRVGEIDTALVTNHEWSRLLLEYGRYWIAGSMASAVVLGLAAYPLALILWDAFVKVKETLPHPHLPHLPHRAERPGSGTEPQGEAGGTAVGEEAQGTHPPAPKRSPEPKEL